MSASAPAKPSKVHFSEYIRTQDKPDEESAAPAEPAEPAKPEAE